MSDAAFTTKTPLMRIIDAVPVPVKAALRRIGYPAGAVVAPEVRELFDEMLALSGRIMEHRCAYRFLKIVSRAQGKLDFKESDFSIESEKVTKMLRNSSFVVVFMVTIGARLEAEVSDLFERGETTRGFILDAIGSETADEVANVLHRELLREEAEHSGFRITPRFSPGYGDWPLSVQSTLLELCGGERIGIAVNEQSLMIPRKSVSAVAGLERV